MRLPPTISSKLLVSPFGPTLLALQHLLQEITLLSLSFYRRRRLYSYTKGKQSLKLNLGCGQNLKSGWLNLDLSPFADFRIDLRRELPIANLSASCIFAEHFLEHLEYPDTALRFTKDCFRMLETGGALYLSVPDSETPLRAYASEHPIIYFNSDQVKAWHDSWCQTPLEHINYHFRQNRRQRPPHHPEYHHFAYDFETLSKLLSEAGFTVIKRREFNADLDTENRREGSLRISAIKCT